MIGAAKVEEGKDFDGASLFPERAKQTSPSAGNSSGQPEQHIPGQMGKRGRERPPASAHIMRRVSKACIFKSGAGFGDCVSEHPTQGTLKGPNSQREAASHILSPGAVPRVQPGHQEQRLTQSLSTSGNVDPRAPWANKTSTHQLRSDTHVSTEARVTLSSHPGSGARTPVQALQETRSHDGLASRAQTSTHHGSGPKFLPA